MRTDQQKKKKHKVFFLFSRFIFKVQVKGMGVPGRKIKYGSNHRLTKRNKKTIGRRKEKVQVCLFPFHSSFV
jgi:hypothetical protein